MHVPPASVRDASRSRTSPPTETGAAVVEKAGVPRPVIVRGTTLRSGTGLPSEPTNVTVSGASAFIRIGESSTSACTASSPDVPTEAALMPNPSASMSNS